MQVNIRKVGIFYLGFVLLALLAIGLFMAVWAVQSYKKNS